MISMIRSQRCTTGGWVAPRIAMPPHGARPTCAWGTWGDRDLGKISLRVTVEAASLDDARLAHHALGRPTRIALHSLCARWTRPACAGGARPTRAGGGAWCTPPPTGSVLNTALPRREIGRAEGQPPAPPPIARVCMCVCDDVWTRRRVDTQTSGWIEHQKKHRPPTGAVLTALPRTGEAR